MAGWEFWELQSTSFKGPKVGDPNLEVILRKLQGLLADIEEVYASLCDMSLIDLSLTIHQKISDIRFMLFYQADRLAF